MVTTDFKSFPKDGKLLGIDWGKKRIGLAVSSPDRQFVFTRPTIKCGVWSVECGIGARGNNCLPSKHSFRAKKIISPRDNSTLHTPHSTLKYSTLSEVIHEEEITGIVLGLPLRLDGTESETTALVRKFAADLATVTDIPILLFDESLTSFEAHDLKPQTPNLDSESARILLENAIAVMERG